MVELTPVESAMHEHQADFDSCYTKHLSKKKSNEGKVLTVFHINAKGKVTHASIQSTTLKNPATEKCILKAIKKVKFQKIEDVKGLEAHYPFNFGTQN